MMIYNEITLSNVLKEFVKNSPVILLCALGWDLNFFLANSRILLILLIVSYP